MTEQVEGKREIPHAWRGTQQSQDFHPVRHSCSNWNTWSQYRAPHGDHEISWPARYVIEPKRCGTWLSFPNACLGLLVYGRNFSVHRLWMLGGCPQSHDTLVVLAIAVSNKAQAAAMQ